MARVLNTSSQKHIKLQKNCIHSDHKYLRLNAKEKAKEKADELMLINETVEIDEGIDLYVNVTKEENRDEVKKNPQIVIILDDKPSVIEKKKKQIALKVKIKDLCTVTFQNAVNYGLEKFDRLSEFVPEDLLVVYSELGRIGKTSQAPVWESGFYHFEQLQSFTINNNFWLYGQQLLNDEASIDLAINYLSDLAPPIYLTFNYFKKKTIATEFNRGILNYFWKATQEIVINNDKGGDKQESAIKTVPTSVPDEKAEAIFYYVVGATVHSVFRKNKKGSQESFLSTLALTGISSTNIGPYVGVIIPRVVSWILKQNRGGLTFVKIKTFELFKEIDKEVNTFYQKNQPFKSQSENSQRKELVMKKIDNNMAISNLWNEILNENCDISKDVGFRKQVLKKLLESFLKLRGKGLKLFLVGKHFGDKMHKSKPGLRKGLKKKIRKEN